MSKVINKGIGEGASIEIYAALAYDSSDRFGGYEIKSILHNTTYREYFRNTSQSIYSSTAGQLDIVAATVAITGNLTVSGSITYGATAIPVTTTYLGDLKVGINDYGYDVTFYGATSGKYFLWDQSADGVVLLGTLVETGNMSVTGTFTLTGAPTITGAVTITGDVGITGTTTYTGAVNVGVDATGYDVIFYGETSTYQWKWDQNQDTNGGVTVKGTFVQTGAMTLTGALTMTGNAGITGDVTLTGALVQTGAVQITGAVTVGIDATGHDVIFYAETTGYSWTWDQNQDTNGGMTVIGTSVLTGAVTITGAVGITGAVTMATSQKIQFRDTGIYIQSSGDGILDIVSDTTINITGATTHTGALTMATTSKIQFLDTGLYIYSSANGQLDVIGDTTVKVTAPTIELEASTAVILDGDTTIYGAHTLTSSTAGANFLGKLTLGVTGSVLTHTAGTPTFQVMTTNNSTGTESVQSYFESTFTGTGGVGQALKAYLAINAVGGAYLTALYGVLDLKTNGMVTGLGSGVCAELIMNGSETTQGIYAPLELELGCSTSWSGTKRVSFIYASTYGTTTDNYDVYGYFLNLQGVVDDTGHMFHGNTAADATHGLRILINNTEYDILLHESGTS
jgi:hypothetical protein